MNNLGVVLYTDGGTFQSNPGPIGSGVHGYSYTPIKMGCGIGLKGVHMTQLGYIEKKDNDFVQPEEELDIETLKASLKTLSPYYTVTPVEIINYYECGSEVSTNNAAEIKAMIIALKYILEHKPVMAFILSDSKYVIDGLTKRYDAMVKANFKNRSGEDIPNKDLWIEIGKLYKECEATLTFKIEKVKGHSKDVGNDLADKLASIGASMSDKTQKTGLLVGEVKSCVITRTASPDIFFKDPAMPHPLLSTKRFYFNPAHDHEHSLLYFLGEPGDTDGDEYQGKQVSDASLAIVKLNEPDPFLEDIKQFQLRYLDEKKNQHVYGKDCLVIGHLNVITNKSIYNDYKLFGEDLVSSPQSTRPDLELFTKDPLTTVMVPPYLSMRTYDAFSSLLIVLDMFESKQFNGEIFDITDEFYEVKTTKNKKKTTLLPAFNQKVKYVEKEVILNDKRKTVRLTLGIHLPARNALKRLETYDPQVSLLVWNLGKDLYQFATVISLSNGETGIWSASTANQFLLF